MTHRLGIRAFGAASLALAAFFGTGCGAAYKSPVIPPQGLIYTQVKAPLDYDFNATTAKNEEGRRLRKGRSHTKYIFVPLLIINFDVAWGDAALGEAAKDGNLSIIHYADYEMMHVLGLYAEYRVTAYGE